MGLEDVKNTILPNEEFLLNREEIYLFTLQMISYLSLEKPQITESDLTKNSYKPRKAEDPIRNRWSEVTISDVGIRYGKTIRTKLEESESMESENSNTLNNTEPIGEHPARRSPAPHFRSAHWHRYWVGEGRTELRVNWIEPTFVGDNVASNVVIHKVI